MKLRFWRRKRATPYELTPVRDQYGYINPVHSYTVLRLAVLNAVEEDLGLELSPDGATVSAELWDRIATECHLPTVAVLREWGDITAHSWLFNAAIGVANIKRRRRMTPLASLGSAQLHREAT